MPMHETLAKHREHLFGTDESFAAETLRALGRGTNPALAEKSTHALEYVAQLKAQGMRFVFVGGTAAQLLLAGGISRLSKDVDVVAPDSSADDWRGAVAAIAERFGTEVYQATEEQRDHGGLAIPALHFLIAYPTVFPSKAVADIELDVVLAPARFPTQETLLATHYYTTKEPMAATTPTVEALFGGKLTTLGPGTIGIPRGKANFDLATGKQLFDLSHLLAHVRDLGAVAQAYRAAYEQQRTYHAEGERPTLEAVLDDALYALKLLAAPPGANGPGEHWASDLASLSQAAVKLRGYVGDKEKFDRLAARRAAGAVALALVFVRKILLDQVPAQDAQTRWLAHLASITDSMRDQDALAAARSRIQQIPWAERPHINIREFVTAVGPKPLLSWDAVYQELMQR
ncbi:MAG: nucleotidyl transferase AbiEii/AbiGii toxin family protein [Chloroflexota bacterium]